LRDAAAEIGRGDANTDEIERREWIARDQHAFVFNEDRASTATTTRIQDEGCERQARVVLVLVRDRVHTFDRVPVLDVDF
jgi:hypothetical protein